MMRYISGALPVRLPKSEGYGAVSEPSPIIRNHRPSETIIQVKNTGNIRLENAEVWDAKATLSCNGVPAMLEPEQSFACSGSSVLSWVTIDAGIVQTTSRWAHILQIIQQPS